MRKFYNTSVATLSPVASRVVDELPIDFDPAFAAHAACDFEEDDMPKTLDQLCAEFARDHYVDGPTIDVDTDEDFVEQSLSRIVHAYELEQILARTGDNVLDDEDTLLDKGVDIEVLRRELALGLDPRDFQDALDCGLLDIDEFNDGPMERDPVSIAPFHKRVKDMANIGRSGLLEGNGVDHFAVRFHLDNGMNADDFILVLKTGYLVVGEFNERKRANVATLHQGISHVADMIRSGELK